VRYAEVGGVRVSVIGLGTWQFGSREWGYGAEYADRVAGRLVERALERGVNLIDTAEIYGLGRSERIIGEALGDRRPDAFLATKLFPLLPVPPVVAWRARRSAARLRTEVIDLYQIHWPNPVVPLRVQVRGLRRLLDAGIARHVGVSNFSLRRWQAAERALGAPVLSNQVQYSLVARRPDAGSVPYAAANDRLVIAYSPLGMGLLSGRYDADHPPTGAARTSNPLFLPENLERARPLLGALTDIAAVHGATPAQVALAWVVSHPNVVAIPGASRLAQLDANVDAAGLDLSADELARLTEASDAFRPVRGPKAAAGLLRARLRR
jgi:aryl-alcohol dehydrogenase-like predicted oxidoreductase